MKNFFKLPSLVLFVLLLTATLSTPAFAISEAELEAQVNAAGKEAVTGSVLIWFLCAVGFLKVSQKIDSFMASLGVNVGHTGGSLLAEAMIVTRSISSFAGAAGHAIGSMGRHGAARSTPIGTPGTPASTGFFKGGLAGMVNRKVSSDAIKKATSQSSAVSSVNSKAETTAVSRQRSDMHASGQFRSKSDSKATSNTASAFSSKMSHAVTHTSRAIHTVPLQHPSIGGAIFAKSVASGGSFANDVIGTVARGDLRSTGSIKGDMASQALMSYMGFTALGDTVSQQISYSNVEIGGGRITGVEATPHAPEGISFSMYQVDQYAAPAGDYQKVFTADGTQWYKQYAVDTIIKAPFKVPDGEIDYTKEIVKRLPDPPKRKDRM